MRLDLFLKASRLIKRRSLAKGACEAGHVKVGGVKAKPGRELKVGDQVEVTLPGRRLLIRIEKLPSGSVSKVEAAELYRVIGEERRSDEAEPGSVA